MVQSRSILSDTSKCHSECIFFGCQHDRYSSCPKLFRRGEEILKADTEVEDVFMIHSGIVKLGIRKNDQERVLWFLFTDDLIGASLIHDTKRYGYYCTALTDVGLCHLQTEKLIELTRLVPEIDRQLYQINHKWTNILISRIECLSFLSPEARVAEMLIECSENSTFVKYSLWQQLDINDKSNFCCVPVDELSAILESMESRHILRLSPDLIILDRTKLAAIREQPLIRAV